MLELQRNLYVLRRWWWLLVGATLVGGLVAYGVTKALVKPQYQATSLVALAPEDPTGVFSAAADAQRVSTLASAQAAVRQVPGVSARDLAAHVTGSPSPDNQLLYVQVKWPTADLAPRLADALATTFIRQERARLEKRYSIIHASLVAQERHLAQLIRSTSGSGPANTWLQGQYADALSKIYQQDAQSRSGSSLQETALELAQPAPDAVATGVRATFNAALGAALGLLLALVIAFAATGSYGASGEEDVRRPVLTKVGD
ncbi:MAG: hypothetical protein JOZ41_08455 [Chloroflexi bacterium]|nr:hypothetical protein [Chloroflexota bacterium]